MKSVIVATIQDKSPLQSKTFTVRRYVDGPNKGKYELNVVMPYSSNLGIYNTPAECINEAKHICVVGVTCKKTEYASPAHPIWKQ